MKATSGLSGGLAGSLRAVLWSALGRAGLVWLRSQRPLAASHEGGCSGSLGGCCEQTWAAPTAGLRSGEARPAQGWPAFRLLLSKNNIPKQPVWAL